MKKSKYLDFFQKVEKSSKKYNHIFEILIAKNINYNKQIYNFPISQGVIKLT